MMKISSLLNSLAASAVGRSSDRFSAVDQSLESGAASYSIESIGCPKLFIDTWMEDAEEEERIRAAREALNDGSLYSEEALDEVVRCLSEELFLLN